jgi:hypothetical protein
MGQRRFRIYLEYYSGGDLKTALGCQFQNWTPPLNGHIWGPYPLHIDGGYWQAWAPPHHTIPEGFIWHVARSLIKACLVLQFGTSHSPCLPHWKPMTHFGYIACKYIPEVGRQQQRMRASNVSSIISLIFLVPKCRSLRLWIFVLQFRKTGFWTSSGPSGVSTCCWRCNIPACFR